MTDRDKVYKHYFIRRSWSRASSTRSSISSSQGRGCVFASRDVTLDSYL